MDRFVVGRIIKKLLHRRNKPSIDPLQIVEISKDGLQQSNKLFKKNKRAAILPITSDLPDKLEVGSRKNFLQYQGELEAAKLIKDVTKPNSPTKILKLPRN